MPWQIGAMLAWHAVGRLGPARLRWNEALILKPLGARKYVLVCINSVGEGRKREGGEEESPSSWSPSVPARGRAASFLRLCVSVCARKLWRMFCEKYVSFFTTCVLYAYNC